MTTTTDTDEAQRPADGPQMAETHDEAAEPSVLDRIRRMRVEAETSDARQLILDVPGYEDRLAIIYRFPPEGVERVLRGVERRASAEKTLQKLEGAADVLVACAAAVVGRDENGSVVDLISGAPIADGELPENPLRLDKRLGDLLGIVTPPEVKGVARHVCRHLYSPMAMQTGVYEGDLAMIGQSTVVIGWLNGAEVELDESLMGE